MALFKNLKLIQVLIILPTVIFIKLHEGMKYNNHYKLDLNDDYQKNLSKIILEDSDFNRSHPYYKYFKSKDSTFITGIYYINKQNTNPKIKYKKRGEYLIFTLLDGKQKKYDTVKNSFHPNHFISSKRNNTIPVSGKLLDGIWSNLKNNPKGNTSITLYLKDTSASVKIEITKLNGKPVTKLVDKYLKKGNYKYRWKPNQKGSFFMNVYTNNQKMTYLIKVKK